MFLFTLRLGARELLSSIFQRKLPAGIGARDFLVLVIFYILLTTLVAFFLSAYHWLPQRFGQTLLGNIEPNTALVRLQTNYLRQDGLDYETIQLFKHDPELAGLQLSVQRKLIINSTSVIALPTNNNRLKIDALAIDRDSQFWLWLAANSQAPAPDKFELAVVVNKAAFAKKFSPQDYQDYRRQILSGGKAKLLAQYVPEYPANDDLSGLSHLVFFVNERSNEYSNTTSDKQKPPSQYPHPFRIIWVDGMPLPESVELVLPLDTFDLLQAVFKRDKARYASEGRGVVANRISKITAEKYTTQPEVLNQLRTVVTGIADCLTGVGQPALPVVESEYKMVINAPWLNQPSGSANKQDRRMNFSSTALNKCLQSLGAYATELVELGDLRTANSVIDSAYDYLSPGLLAAHCNYMDKDDINLARIYFYDAWQLCEADKESHLAGRFFTEAFYRATVAVGENRPLEEVTNSLVNWTTAKARINTNITYQSDVNKSSNRESLPVFRLDDNYKKSLARYKLLVDIARSLVLPAVALLGITIMILLVTKLHTMFEHRLAQYQLLAINGMRPNWIATLVAYQSMLAALLGAIAGLGLGWLVIYWLSQYFASANAELLQDIRESLGLSFDALLSQPPIAWLAIYVLGFSLAAFGLGYFVAWRLGIVTANSATAILQDT